MLFVCCVICVVGLARGKLRYLVGLVVGGVISTAFAIAVVGPANVLRYPQALISGELGSGLSGVAANQMQNVRGFFNLIFSCDSNIVWLISSVMLLITLCAVGWLWRDESKTLLISKRKFQMLASLTTLLMLVTSLHTHTQDYLLAFLPCVWLAELTTWDWQKMSVLKRVLFVFIVLFPAFSWLFFFTQPLFARLCLPLYSIWALTVIALVLAGGLLKEPQCLKPTTTKSKD